MKLPFRFFRGEFNGFYLYRALTCLNTVIKELIDELVYQANFQWKTALEVSGGELPIRDEDIIGVGRIAGLSQDRLWARSLTGSVAFTPSHVVKGKQRSERGLVDMSLGTVQFVRTEHDDYPDDIATEATPSLRTSLVPSGTEPVGYVAMGVEIYTEGGDLIWENVLSEPPDDGTPYTPFYGEQYLVGEEWFVKDDLLPVSVFKELLECFLRIRRNGPTLKAFFDASMLLVGGVVKDMELTLMPGRYYMLHYSVDPSSTKSNQDRLIQAWLWMCEAKFKLFIPQLREGV
jgi:hypothetical protein